MTPHTHAASVLFLVLATVTVRYGLRCWITPFRPCRRCQGLGRRRAGRRTVRHCRPCRGTGVRLRAGRWIYNHFVNIRRAGR